MAWRGVAWRRAEKTQHMCVDSFNIDEMVNKNTSMGLILKPGSSCLGTHGYCDIFSKCRSVDGEGPLLRLKKFLLSPVTLSSIRLWVTVGHRSLALLLCLLLHSSLCVPKIIIRLTGGELC